MKILFLAPIALFLSVLARAEAPVEIRVAAAADLRPALNELIQMYEQTNHDQKVTAVIGSSGNLVTEIKNGAPFDVFMSADAGYPKELEKAGLVSGKSFRYATGRIVLWVHGNSKLDLSKGLAVLRDPSIHSISIANPEHAPYGRAAVEALKNAGIYDAIHSELVLGDNVAQAAQFVQTRSADIGIIAMSTAKAMAGSTDGRFVPVDDKLYKPLEQTAVVTKNTKHLQDAERFCHFIKSDQARQILARFGFAS